MNFDVTMTTIFAFLTALSVGISIFPVLIKVFSKFNYADIPGGRKIHQDLIPSMGGIGFVVAALLSFIIWNWPLSPLSLRYLVGGIVLVFFVGLRDDMVELRASHKLLGQLVAVLLVVIASDIRIKNLHGFLGIEELPLYISYAFSAFVMLALTNAFNLIDGLDGLAGTMAVIVFSFLGCWFMMQGLDSFAILSFTFLAGVLAFLVFNWHPAKIFMGDTGSLTLGFTMGALIIAFMEYNVALPTGTAWKFEAVFSTGVALMMFPLYDMARVFYRRIRRGQGPMTPDKSHVHHFLMRMGLKHNQVALILGAVQLSFIAIVLLLKDYSDNLVLPVISVLAISLGLWLDLVAVKKVKKKVAKLPKVLDVHANGSTKRAKIKMDLKKITDSKVNMN